MKLKKMFVWYCVLYLFLYLYRGAYGVYIPIYLKETLHFSYAQVGIVSALGSFFAMISIPLIGYLVTKSQAYKRFIFIILCALLGLTYLYAQANTFIMILIVGVLFDSLSESNAPIADSMSVLFTDSSGLAFGSIRSFGSVGYIVGSLVTGYILNKTGHNGNLFMLTAISLFGAIIALGQVKQPNTERIQTKGFLKDISILVNIKQYRQVLIMVIFSIALTNATGPYINLHLVETLKASKEIVGILIFFMVIPEVVVMGTVHKMHRRLGTRRLLLIAQAVFVIRWLLYSLITSAIPFIGVSMLHAISMGILIPTYVMMIRRIVPTHLFASGVSLYVGFTFLMMSLIKMFHGYLSDSFSTTSVFYANTILALIGLAYLYFYYKKEGHV